ncbi:hypothetical protein [Pectobacterium brasiliense]|uniref:hypothetical protein n=1 Tax=Pectobacterium brasiliense TaxID=180957 RepID=UPI001F0807F9|nr:hypothetical protein [Pectobacterium brasiliense]
MQGKNWPEPLIGGGTKTGGITQRLAQRGLVQEYDNLLAQLDIEQLRQKAKCYASAKDCCDAHVSALRD